MGANMRRHEIEIHLLGCFVHGVLAAFHGLGVLYNFRRKNWMDTTIHVLGTGYDAWAVRNHYRKAVTSELETRVISTSSIKPSISRRVPIRVDEPVSQQQSAA
jgi:hypothetical protein